MSTLSSQLNSASWSQDWNPDSEQDLKQEVNRRLAIHKSRKGVPAAVPAAPREVAPSVGNRAAEAAARVAARYAKAPSYSEMQASDARAAVRAAEIATQAALQAQAAAQVVLAGFEAAAESRDNWDVQDARISRTEPPVQSTAVPFQQAAPLPVAGNSPVAPDVTRGDDAEWQSPMSCWGADMQVRQAEPTVIRVEYEIGRPGTAAEDWRNSAPLASEELTAASSEPVEPEQPIFANLIEFPSELVATRKARPRLAERSYAAVSPADGQLSIFEVDPGTISVEPEPADVAAQPVGSEWSDMELDAQSQLDTEPEEVPSCKASTVELASISRRLLAKAVDGALILGAFLAAAAVAASNVKQMPGLKETEIGAVAALLVTTVVYLVVFHALAESTPGMKYAGITLCTFSDEMPTRAQRCGRLCALLLSLLPVGLGIMWGLFDEEHLSWHDRLSRTYQRRCLRTRPLTWL